MKDLYFKIIGQKTSADKMILVAVVPTDIFGNVPDIFEAQAVKLSPTIYSGIYPNIRVIPPTIVDRTDLRGHGIDGILMAEGWYNKEVTKEDPLGVGIEDKN